jgi:hypothetical protein
MKLEDAARHAWLERAADEARSADLMAILAEAFTAAGAHDHAARARAFVDEERVHSALCAEIAIRFGAAPPAPPPRVTLPASSALELAVRILCVGETLSFGLLAANLRRATDPQMQRALHRIVRDEAGHARLGWDHLDDHLSTLSAALRRHLREVAEAQIAGMERLCAELVPVRGVRARELHSLGSLEVDEYRAVVAKTIRKHVRAPLDRRGIR